MVSTQQGRQWLAAAKEGELVTLFGLLDKDPALLHHQVCINSSANIPL